jgi:hypothetical protein
MPAVRLATAAWMAATRADIFAARAEPHRDVRRDAGRALLTGTCDDATTVRPSCSLTESPTATTLAGAPPWDCGAETGGKPIDRTLKTLQCMASRRHEPFRCVTALADQQPERMTLGQAF